MGRGDQPLTNVLAWKTTFQVCLTNIWRSKVTNERATLSFWQRWDVPQDSFDIYRWTVNSINKGHQKKQNHTNPSMSHAKRSGKDFWIGYFECWIKIFNLRSRQIEDHCYLQDFQSLFDWFNDKALNGVHWYVRFARENNKYFIAKFI